LKDSFDLRPYSRVFVDSSAAMTLKQVENQYFMPLDSFHFGARYDSGRYDYWLQLEVANSSPTDTLHLSFNLVQNYVMTLLFYAFEQGQLTDSIVIHHLQRPHPQVEKTYFPSVRTIGFKLAPSSKKKIYVRLNNHYFPKPLQPMLFRAEAEVNFFYKELMYVMVWNIAFIAILIFALLLTLINFIQYQHRAFVYYAAYIAAQCLFYWSELAAHDQFTDCYFPMAARNYAYEDLISHGWIGFYMLFTYSFLDAKVSMPNLYRLSVYFIYFYSIAFGINCILIRQDYLLSMKWMSNALILLNVIGLIMVIYMFWFVRKNHLARYVLGGTLGYTIGSIFTRFTQGMSPFWDDSLIYHQIGVLVELFFFSTGLAYKAQKDAVEKERYFFENQQLIHEKERSIAQVRSQIAQDIHDEVGAGLTKISLSAQVAVLEASPELPKKLEKLGRDARHLARQLREIIFAMNPDFDHFHEMQAYFREVANDFWEESPILIHFDFPKPAVLDLKVPPDIKRQLLCIFKEAQNNIAKHANATEIHLVLKTVAKQDYLLEIRDNGKGFDYDEQHLISKGLSGMRRRAAQIKADFYIWSSPNNGTIIRVTGSF
jgi:signal transduction histidine kinase